MTTIKEFFGSASWQKFRNLTRPKHNVLGGVCAALGEATPFAAWMWRVLFCSTTLAWGAGAVGYIILWICIPADKSRAA